MKDLPLLVADGRKPSGLEAETSRDFADDPTYHFGLRALVSDFLTFNQKVGTRLYFAQHWWMLLMIKRKKREA